MGATCLKSIKILEDLCWVGGLDIFFLNNQLPLNIMLNMRYILYNIKPFNVPHIIGFGPPIGKDFLTQWADQHVSPLRGWNLNVIYLRHMKVNVMCPVTRLRYDFLPAFEIQNPQKVHYFVYCNMFSFFGYLFHVIFKPTDCVAKPKIVFVSFSIGNPLTLPYICDHVKCEALCWWNCCYLKYWKLMNNEKVASLWFGKNVAWKT